MPQLIRPAITLVILSLLVVAAPVFAVSQVELELFRDLLGGNNVVCRDYQRPGVYRNPCVGFQSGGQHDGFFREIRQDHTFRWGDKDVLRVAVNQGRLVTNFQIFIDNLPASQLTTITATRNSINQLLPLQNIPQEEINALRSRVYGITKSLSAPSGTSTVIMVGLEGPGGSRIYTNREQGLQSESRGAERAASGAVRFALTAGRVDVRIAEPQPIAVLPPGIFGQPAGETGYRAISPETFLERTRIFLFNLSVPAFILLVILGGLLMILAPFSKAYIDLGKKYIYWAVIGYVVLLVASAAIALLPGLFGAR